MKFYSLNQLPLHTDDFFFTYWNDVHVKDTIVVHNPMDSVIVTPVFLRSRKSLDEHIAYIQEKCIKRAIVVGNDIQFLKECPSLEYLKIFPSIDAEGFDFSPLYELPKIKSLECATMYGLRAMYDVEEPVRTSEIDYSRFPHLRQFIISGAEGHLNTQKAETVTNAFFEFGFPKAKSLSGTIPGNMLEVLSIQQAPIESLEGIEVSHKLRRLDLTYNRRLTDIASLRNLKDTLGYLEIDRCGKIKDFSVLSELRNLEFLILKGSNTLSDVSFLRNMPKLKYLQLDMNVLDGDLRLCEKIPYVRIKNRKHYSHKDKDMPKDYTEPESLYPFRID